MGGSCNKRKYSILLSETYASYVSCKPLASKIEQVTLDTWMNEISMKILTGVRCFPVNTIAITDTGTAIGAEAMSKAAKLVKMMLFFRMILISRL